MLESPFNKVAGLKVCVFIKQLFSCEYSETLKTDLFYRTPDNFGYKIDVFHIPCAIALFSFITLLESVFHGYSVLVFIPKL